MKKVWIYILLIVALVLGTFYIMSEKKKPVDTDNNISQGEQEEQEKEKKKDDDNPDQKPEEDPSSSMAVGKPLPDFTLKNLSGEDITLSEIKDKIILINFWATWCTWCDKEMPDIQRLKNENEDLIVLAVNVDEREDKVQKYMEDGGYDFEVLLDKGGKISAEYLVTGLPTSYFVDKDGNLVGRAPGALSYEQMNKVLNDIR